MLARSGSKAFDVRNCLREIRQFLPTQGPLKDFIHHNTLHAWQNLPFEQAVSEAGKRLGARGYGSMAYFREAYQEGKITELGLAQALREAALSSDESQQVKSYLYGDVPAPASEEAHARGSMRAKWFHKLGFSLDRLVQPILFRLLAHFCDQGLSVWRMPHATLPFYAAMQTWVRQSWLPFYPLAAQQRAVLLVDDPCSCIETCLRQLVESESLFKPYLEEMILGARGWMGMVSVLEEKPDALLLPRRISLESVCAIALLLEWAFVEKLASKPLPQLRPVSLGAQRQENHREKDPHLIYQKALEYSFYQPLIERLSSQASEKEVLDNAASQVGEAKVVFCIDDRECSLRRHLEACAPWVKTYSTAGFFGLDFVFQPAGSPYHSKQCPVVMRPNHLVCEVPLPSPVKRPQFLQRLSFQFWESSNTLFRGWLLTQIVGLVALGELLLQVFRPGWRLLSHVRLSGSALNPTKLVIEREGEEKRLGFFLGYSVEEMAERVADVLIDIGLRSHWGDLIVVVGHGSTSANNPYFAAYDCGACCGKPGSPNARAFVLMANHPTVRARLREKQIEIPASCVFVAALHDTATDTLMYYEGDSPTTPGEPLWNTFRESMQEALGKNAQERCKKFELAPPNPTPSCALAHVRERAAALFEVRPEYNHATNAVCIIGPRAWTRGLFLDRRAFLQSYEPECDRNGAILSRLLSALLPVCAGINLEYYFSRVDNEVYGAGSKLSHNVIGLLGVAHGIEGDLLTGLPRQMIEIHDPLRLLVVVRQEHAVVEEVVKKSEALQKWVEGEWVHFAVLGARGHALRYRKHGFTRWGEPANFAFPAKDVLPGDPLLSSDA